MEAVQQDQDPATQPGAHGEFDLEDDGHESETQGARTPQVCCAHLRIRRLVCCAERLRLTSVVMAGSFNNPQVRLLVSPGCANLTISPTMQIQTP